MTLFATYKLSNLVKLVTSLIITLGAGWLGSIFTRSSVDTWYATLAKPSFAPPNSIFAPVWTVLYLLMGLALYLVWSQNSAQRGNSLQLFAAQLILNVLWSVVFFGLESTFGGVVVIVLLWVAIYMTIRSFAAVSEPAAWLMVPYLLWVTYAAILNIAIWWLNR